MKSLVIFIGNPAAGRASFKKLGSAFDLIKDKVPKVKFLVTEKAGDAERFSREALISLPDLIIAAGGDGTFNEVINGIAGSAVPMAMLPMGTVNVLARELEIPMDLKKAVDTALEALPHSVSLGKVIANSGRARYFSLMAGIGIDAEAVYGIKESPAPKRAYILSGIKKLFSWNPEELSLFINGGTYKGFSLVVCNSARYGGDFKMAPHADIKEPLLYVFIMHGKSKLDMLRYAGGVIRGRHLKLKDITYLSAKSISIEGSSRIQIDGDYIGKTPATIEAAPNALYLVY